MKAELCMDLILAGFEKVTNAESTYEKWTHQFKFSAHPVPGKTYWTLLIDDYNGHIESYTFQKVEHLIDFSNRYLRKTLQESRWTK